MRIQSKRLSYVGLVGALIVLLIVPLVQDPRENPFLINMLIMTFYYSYLSGSWNILAGYTGQYSFGHAAFVGLGAYTVAMLYNFFAVSPWIGMLVGAAIAACASFGVGLPSLRLKKHYFILITLAFAEILRITFLNWREFSRGAAGIDYKLVDFSFVDFQFNTNRAPYYYFMLGLLVVSILICYKLRASTRGFYFVAVREDEIAAESLGVNVVQNKLISATLSAVLTAFAGAFYAQYILFVDPDSVFSLDVMVKIFLPTALGGIGTLFGPTVGAFILIPISEVVRVSFGYIPGLHLIMYGAVLLAVSVVMPRGIVGTIFRSSSHKSSVLSRVLRQKSSQRDEN